MGAGRPGQKQAIQLNKRTDYLIYKAVSHRLAAFIFLLLNLLQKCNSFLFASFLRRLGYPKEMPLGTPTIDI